ncbi:bifunctional 2-C-methyl-D-erythritol 4-phosphate cytidylyltransferase/2-C-methyl-D-erythritol 2,4-cyclodiphosphate synthase [Stakelama tenebrarum]|uniref:Bifunctional enzyme IspD/IspF n=1 Tax=Stakelama tenebrarum TaxID=2711215 RepID=A0A6G6Y5V9_9SPHN|nr:bifunctional 2-C-methyl-D-erythritol 4-phosphate cytidylyltransferase/2-C-methyl-D-erythritol 2,4-cyclodiphosphate synthase [Sphingosinithalassobacter tenebrarum]QIG80305.1 bifunctional 2-C-methyl-D-erythritol 4-phosphate cytidylyltransferase/2-C-methyl-D-erythritol 2,4-cyclodiphosphate synthase [Sphingosinithalassobacter tenebrarum]
MGRTVAIIVAAGTGSRMGGDPKQYRLLSGRPVIAHSHAALARHPGIDAVLVVIGRGQEAMLAKAIGDVPFVVGGASRRESVRNGLEAIAAQGSADSVLIHDAARPIIPASVIDSLLIALQSKAGATPALPVADTIARGSSRGWVPDTLGTLGDIVDRSTLVRIQTPQAFHFDAILAAHRNWPADREATDDAQMLRRSGEEIALVPGDTALEKLTHPDDLALAELRLGAGMISRSATGFDVHRYAEGKPLWLGGIEIPSPVGLSGHSDADVLLHAITDALLGTIGEGDIGLHFPPSDPQWAGAASSRFLEHAASLIRARGGFIDFVDATIICERPKIGPHREAIRQSVAALLRLPVEAISIKATTTERLGFTGRGEGMAAQAIATVRLKGNGA